MRPRDVVVVMPFGEPGAEHRKAILNFRRIKYLIEEKCQVVPAGPRMTEMRVAYDVDVARTVMGEITDAALRKISEADILIALLSERNITVTYELGYRRARNKTPVILIRDSQIDVPIYEVNVAYQSWVQGDVLESIDRIASKNYPLLDDFKGDMPGELKDVVDSADNGLETSLQLALQEIENTFVEPSPDPVQKLRGMLSDAIMRNYPCSVVEVTFSKRGEFEDATTPAQVVEFDEEFSRLYGYAGKDAAVGDGPLTLAKLLNRLKKFSDPDDWNKLRQEQMKLAETMLDYWFARASVPIKINNSHPNDGFRGKSFLPCVVAQVIDSTLDVPHRMYLLVVYIQV